MKLNHRMSAFVAFLLMVLYLGVTYWSPTKHPDLPPNSPFLIYSSYFNYISEDTVAFQVIGFSKLLIGNLDFPISVVILEYGCPNERNCTWVDHKLYAEIPATVNRTESVYIQLNDRERGNKTVEVPISESLLEKRTSGLEVCVAPLYYYNNWIRVVEIIELYRLQKASHFYIYLSSVSRTVDDLLKLYEKKGIVTVVRWPELPKIDSTTDSVFRLGQHSAILDCVLRTKGKFVAVVDLDDYIIVKNRPLLDLLESYSSEHPRAGSFFFSMVLAPQKPYAGDLSDWRSIDFSGLAESDICDHCQTKGKSIVMPDKIHSLTPHSAIQLRKQFGVLGFLGFTYTMPHMSPYYGVSYHVRHVMYSDLNPGVVFERRKLLPEKLIRGIKAGFDTVMEEFTQEERNLSTPDTAQTMQYCNPSNGRVCLTPYKSCRQIMGNVDEWVFAEDVEGFRHRYVVV